MEYLIFFVSYLILEVIAVLLIFIRSDKNQIWRDFKNGFGIKTQSNKHSMRVFIVIFLFLSIPSSIWHCRYFNNK